MAKPADHASLLAGKLSCTEEGCELFLVFEQFLILFSLIAIASVPTVNLAIKAIVQCQSWY